MCGLTGILSFTNTPPAGSIQQMNQALAHRGPNAEGAWAEGRIALGHRRLSIIDLSAAGQQPMHSADGRYVMVFNGEIYNYRELRAELTDYPFSTQTDSEVLLAAYIHWGQSCLSKLKGMFSLAIWDRTEKSLFISRDRLGIKPLYYYINRQYLVFASELRSLLASGLVPRQLSAKGLVDYLRYQTVHAPATILEGVYMLMPGHQMDVVNGQVAIKAYWQPQAAKSYQGQHLAPTVWQEEIKNHLKAAVERRLVADVPFGAFLSGGIDSSAIVALMSQTASGTIKTFSVTFAEEAFSEARYARMVADKFSTQHHEIKLHPNDFLRLLPDALAAMDHPSGDGPNTYVVSQATKAAGITMALSGLGGDELFGGYAIFPQSVRLNRLNGLNYIPHSVRASLAHFLRQLKNDVSSAKIAEVLKLGHINALSAYPLFRQVLLDAQISQLLPNTVLPANTVAGLAQERSQDPGFTALPLLSQISILEMQTYMVNVLLRDTDQMSMAHALEVRVPFLDHELVELVLAISDDIKYPHTPKQLLVAAMGDLLPPAIVNRPKMGFTLPFETWMKGELKTFCAQRLVQIGNRAPFSSTGVQQLWQAFLANQPNVSWSRLWALVVLADWLDRNNV